MTKTNDQGPLFILEMANNHMGNIEHGERIIREFAEVCKRHPKLQFAFKLQYRDLDSYIHPAMKDRLDVKYVKRFSETRLSQSDFDRLVNCMRTNGFLTMATPFDEKSVKVIESQKLDYIKIASCSFTDWPLLESVVQTNIPVIASTAGASVSDIDKVVSFFTHRNKRISILHCIGEYPTPDENSELSQIEFLRTRYPDLRIGYSTHEAPTNTDNIMIAIAKGATIFEKHVGVRTSEFGLNDYSADPEQAARWLAAAERSLLLCGVGGDRHQINTNEADSLRSLRRGVFSKRLIEAGEVIRNDDIYFAFPPNPDQVTANDWSKYAQLRALYDIEPDAPVMRSIVQLVDSRGQVWEIAQRVKAFLKESNVQLPGRTEMEISHHYGIERFYETGITMLTVVNRGYCKKLIVVLPGQRHPEQYHQEKDETFHVLYGEIELILDGVPRTLSPGGLVTVEPGTRHAFTSKNGAVIEELSTSHNSRDSFYTDESIAKNKTRKTLLSYWMD